MNAAGLPSDERLERLKLFMALSRTPHAMIDMVTPALGAIGNRKPAGAAPLIVRGPYRWVRHPLYLVSLIIIWFGPIFTADRLLHNLLWSLWIVIGATLEEKDLVDCFGDAYRDYQQTVPMLIPKSVQPLVKDTRRYEKDAS